jgi:hypothetical protein
LDQRLPSWRSRENRSASDGQSRGRIPLSAIQPLDLFSHFCLQLQGSELDTVAYPVAAQDADVRGSAFNAHESEQEARDGSDIKMHRAHNLSLLKPTVPMQGQRCDTPVVMQVSLGHPSLRDCIEKGQQKRFRPPSSFFNKVNAEALSITGLEGSGWRGLRFWSHD